MKAKTKTTLHQEGLQLAQWILRAMIFVRVSGSYFIRSESRLKHLVDAHIQRQYNSVNTNFIFMMLAVQTVSSEARGGNVHLVAVGVGPMFDFFEQVGMQNVGYIEKSEVFVKDFLYNFDENVPYAGNIHVHTFRYFPEMTIADIIKKLRSDHGPQNHTFEVHTRVYHLELLLGKPTGWQTTTNADLKRICTASVTLAAFILSAHKQ